MKYIIPTHIAKCILLAALFAAFTISNVHAQTKEQIEKALNDAYSKFKDLKEGKNADYIKELATVDPNIYGIAIVTLDGKVYTKGDLDSRVSIQSISKVFTLAKVIDESGAKNVMDKIGVDA